MAGMKRPQGRSTTTTSSTLSDVAVKKTCVFPLGVWRYLAREQQPERSDWPASSVHLCWWCAHTFANVPAFLPVDYDPSTGAFFFCGNFCSWNCVKTYALRLQLGRTTDAPPGACYIGLLAFLTVVKPRACGSTELHELGLCDCTTEFKGVTIARGREVLQAFGGPVTIQEYRQDFHTISSHEAVSDLFVNSKQVTTTMRRANTLPTVRFWGFHKLHYEGPQETYKTWISILPLTNRTLNKIKMVQTGSDDSQMVECGGGGNVSMSSMTSMTSTSSMSSTSGASSSLNIKKSAPTASRISRRSQRQPAPAGQPLPNDQDNATNPHPASASRNSTAPIMSADEVLSCNDEQAFYTQSLRGYGNLLTCMGITIHKANKPPDALG